ncbi:MAG: hypothetical protein XU15_C0024G0029 [candidate division NC10 bacterium CSP1-5]|nr:MAG: hypothetical protein XU15_C0024G0029 [candidate division NC10 bacterium CSP1-5]
MKVVASIRNWHVLESAGFSNPVDNTLTHYDLVSSILETKIILESYVEA